MPLENRSANGHDVLLVDTSVWIEFFRRGGRVNLREVASREELVTCLPVVQEVLQGLREESSFRIARDALLALPVVEAPMRTELFLEAADLFRQARRAGVTIRSSVDCLIAAVALRHDLEVWHRDRDFNAISRIAPLRVRR